MARTGETDEREQGRLKTPAFFALLILAGVVVIGGAIYIGKSDKGQIDIAETIGNSNKAIQDGGGDQSGQVDVVPQSFQNMQNGGLVPQGESAGTESGNQPEQPTSDATGSSTAESGVASSTGAETSVITETEEGGQVAE